MGYLDSEIQRLRAEIDQREGELAGLEAEVLDIQREMQSFTDRYNRLVQPLAARLEIIRSAIAELEAQQSPPPQLGPPPAQLLEQTWTPPPDYVPVEEQYRRMWEIPKQRAAAGLDVPAAHRPAVDDSPAAVKTLYRQLARRYHPDLAVDPQERARRNRLMAEINDAYSRQDVEALQALAAQSEGADLDQPLAAFQLQQLRQVYNQLEQRIQWLKRQRSDLLNGELMWLKIQQAFAARQGRDLLREMADQMEQEYRDCMRRLDELRRL